MKPTQMTPQQREQARKRIAQEAAIRCLACPPDPTPTEWAATQFACASIDLPENLVVFYLGWA